MENKILCKTKMFCPICEEEHEVDLIEKEKETIIKGKKIIYKEKFYRCNKYKDQNTFQNGELWNEGLTNSLDSYREQEELLTSKEIKQIRNKYKITQLEMAKLLGVGDVTVTRYETKQIQDEAHDKIMRLIDENALIALEYLENNKENFKKGQRYEIIENNKIMHAKIIFDTFRLSIIFVTILIIIVCPSKFFVFDFKYCIHSFNHCNVMAYHYYGYL